MVSTDIAARSRGRPREFDEDAVLDAVVDLFWEQGFEAASLADIVEAAGLNKSSLYNAFGSKDELFHRALDRYITGRQRTLDEVAGGSGGLDDLLMLVDLIRVEALSEDGRRGCLAINSSAELGFESPTVVAFAQRFRDALRGAIRRPLERAVDMGEIDAGFVDVYVNTALSYVVAAAVAARAGASPDELEDHLDSMCRLIESWRLA